MKIDKSRFTPSELETYKALIAKAKVDTEAAEVEMEEEMPEFPPRKKVVEEEKVVEDVERKGAMFVELLKDHPAVKEIRRSGLLMAVELGESAKLYRLMDLFIEEGLLSDWFLYCDTAFRISPPLIITDDEIRNCVALIRKCLDRL